ARMPDLSDRADLDQPGIGLCGTACPWPAAILLRQAMDSITLKAAQFVTGFDAGRAPQAARHAARIGFVDCIGCMLAGAAEPAVALASVIATPMPGSNDAAPAVDGRSYGAGDAALVNGVAGHVLDFDDVALAGHPSTVL